MNFCTVIWGPKSKIEFVWYKNLITPFPILPQFKKKCITVYGDFKAVQLGPRQRYLRAVFIYPIFLGSGNLTVLFEFTPCRPLLP